MDLSTITKDVIRKWSGDEFLKAIKDPAVRARVEEVVNTLDPTPEEIQAAADAQAAADQQAADDLAAAQAIKDAADAAAANPPPEPVEVPVERKKFVLDYQATDDKTGQPIGRPTHLEAWSQEELIEKLKTAHIEATRYANRLKTRREQATYQPPAPARLTDEEIVAVAADLQSQDASVVSAAKKKIEEDAKIVEQKKREADKTNQQAQDALDRENIRQGLVSNAFMRNHIADFHPCKANGQILADYIRNNNLEWTEENLELAFLESESQLAPVPQVTATPVSQPTPVVNPPAAAPTEAPAAPVVATPPAMPPAIPAGTAPRRVPGGLEPGVSVTGRQPVSKVPTLTKADVRKWTAPEMRQKLRDPKIKAEFDLLFPPAGRS